MDNIKKGDDVVGDAVGEIKAGDVEGGTNEDESDSNCFDCKICGMMSKTNPEHKNHMSKAHSKFAQSLAKESAQRRSN